MEGDGGGLHCDTTFLLVGSGVEVADLACEFRGDDAIRGKEGVGEGCLSMVLQCVKSKILW